MSGQIIGYVRVSTVDQNSERQLEGIPVDRIFRDSLWGEAVKRPGLDALLEYMRDGDTLIGPKVAKLLSGATSKKLAEPTLRVTGIGFLAVANRIVVD